MDKERYQYLWDNHDAELTDEEIKDGWHFCYSEWDGLLIGPDTPEYECCTCSFKKTDGT